MFFCENLCVSSYKDKRNKVVSVSIGHNEWTASTRAARPVEGLISSDCFSLYCFLIIISSPHFIFIRGDDIFPDELHHDNIADQQQKYIRNIALIGYAC